VSKPQSLPVEKIYVPLSKRKTVDERLVQQIAESILNDGQQVPVAVRPDGDRFVLLDGYHRLEACKALGETTILGILTSAPVAVALQKPAAAYEVNAEAERQKMQRLRQLRLEKEAAESLATSLSATKMGEGSKQPSRNAERQSSPKERLGRSRTAPLIARPKTLSEWLESRERDGFSV
jgi:hypothetical protein